MADPPSDQVGLLRRGFVALRMVLFVRRGLGQGPCGSSSIITSPGAQPSLSWVLIASAALLAACGPPPPLIGIDNPVVPVRSVPDASLQKVFIATTREDSEVVGALFSELRADELGLASVTVSIPPTHQVGRLERPRSLPPDPRTEFAIVDPTRLTAKTRSLRR